MKRLSRLLILCGMVLLALTPVSKALAVEVGLTLIKNGRINGEMILKPEAPYTERFAAMDMRHWLKEMSGATLPVLSTPTSLRNTKIFVGQYFASQISDFNADLARLQGTDGYTIRRKGSSVYVFGARPLGTMFGVFALLEKNTDIIWARPNMQFGTVFGLHYTITLDHTDMVEIPVFPYRGLNGGHPSHEPTELWRLRNGNNMPNRGLGDPKWDTLAYTSVDLSSPLWDQFDKHPEYFGYDPLQGKRIKPGYYNGALCLSAPDMANVWAKAIVEHIHRYEASRDTKLEVLRITPGDNWSVCQCDDCLKPLKLPDGTLLAPKSPTAPGDKLFRSTQIALLLNEAMKRFEVEVPHVKFLVLAYIHMVQPPAVAIDSRYMVQFAPYPTNSQHFPLLDPRQPGDWRELFEGWLKMTPHLGFFEYLYPKPDPIGYYLAANLRALGDGGRDTTGSWIYAENTNDTNSGGNAAGWDIGAANQWVIARLMWNPNQDVDALYTYYYTRVYREAAPQMLQYFKMIKDSWMDPKNNTIQAAHAGIAGIYKGLIIDPGLEAKNREILNAALAAAKHPASKVLVQRMLREYARLGGGLNRLVVNNQPEMSNDGNEFNSLQWEQPELLEGFMNIRRTGDVEAAAYETSLKAARDNKNLYIRFYASDPESDAAVARAKDDTERWPAGDHGEIWFSKGATTWVFAFDCNANAYDAKNLDRRWNSNFTVKTQKTNEGWNAILVIPLDALGIELGKDPGLSWMARREYSHGRDKSIWMSYTGAPLYRRYYPLVVD